MLIRLALESDYPEILEMARDNAASIPYLEFDEGVVRDTFDRYINDANPTLFVAEEKRKLIGFLLASVGGYRVFTGHKTICEVMYVKPAYRGGRAAMCLLPHMIEWSVRLGAREVIGGVDNDFQPDRTAKFFEHFGFNNVGYAMTLEIQNGWKKRR